MPVRGSVFGLDRRDRRAARSGALRRPPPPPPQRGPAASRHVPQLDAPKDALAKFQAALSDLCRDLAQQVARDGEGLTKFVEIAVTGAESDVSARKVALSIGNSPLVKTALAGEDANWGRVVMAVGKAGEPADRDRIAIWFGDHRVAFEGERDPSSS